MSGFIQCASCGSTDTAKIPGGRECNRCGGSLMLPRGFKVEQASWPSKFVGKDVVNTDGLVD